MLNVPPLYLIIGIGGFLVLIFALLKRDAKNKKKSNLFKYVVILLVIFVFLYIFLNSLLVLGNINR
jgi:hypothetical protein